MDLHFEMSEVYVCARTHKLRVLCDKASVRSGNQNGPAMHEQLIRHFKKLVEKAVAQLGYQALQQRFKGDAFKEI